MLSSDVLMKLCLWSVRNLNRSKLHLQGPGRESAAFSRSSVTRSQRTELRGATGHGGVTPTRRRHRHGSSSSSAWWRQTIFRRGRQQQRRRHRFVERCIDILERCADQAWLPRALSVADRGQVHDCTEVRGRQNITWASRPRRNHYHINSSSPPLSSLS